MGDFLLTGIHFATAALKLNRESIVIATPKAANRRIAGCQTRSSGSFFVAAAILLLLYLASSCSASAQLIEYATNHQVAQYPPLLSVLHHKRSRRDITAEPLSSRSLDLTPVSTTVSVLPAANPNFEAAFQGECGKNNNSNPCGHICLDLYDGTYECSCFYGFTLAVDGYSCTPVAPPISIVAPQKLLPPDNSTNSHRQASRLQFSETPQPALAITVDTTILPPTNGTVPKLGLVSDVPLSEASKLDELLSRPAKETVRWDKSRGVTVEGAPFLIEDANDIRKLHDDITSGVKLGETHLAGWLDSRPRVKPEDRHQNDNLALLNRKRRLPQATLESFNRRQPPLVAPTELSKYPSRHTVSSHKDNHLHYYLSHHLHDSLDTKLTSKSDGARFTASAPVDGYVPEQPMIQLEISRGKKDSTNSASNNKAFNLTATHKLSEYKLDHQTEVTNKQSLMGPSGEFIELAESQHVDADIKSIMLANDRLLAELVRSVGAGLASDTRPTTSHNIKDGQFYELLAEGDDSSQDDSLPDLRLLGDLMRKSVEDFQGFGAAFQQTAIRLDGSLQSAKLSESATAAASGKPLARASGTEARPIEASGATSAASTVYSNCRQLPECQAGGLCSMEQVASGFPSTIRSRARCRCPLGRAGLLCQRSVQLSVPSFTGNSYLALPVPENHLYSSDHLKHLRLVFRPAVASVAGRRSSLLLSAPSFTLLLDGLNRVQLRYTSGAGAIRVMGSRDARSHIWNELIVTQDASNDTNMIEQHQPNSNASYQYHIHNRIILVTPAEIPLSSGIQQEPASSRGAQLFVAGLPQFAALYQKEHNYDPTTDAEDALDSLQSLPNGFSGCIKEFSINGREYNFGSDFKGDALDGFDIITQGSGASSATMNNSWLFMQLVLLMAVALFTPAATICPTPQDIKPCTCDDEGLQCLKLNDSRLISVFQAEAEKKAIRRVWIFQTNITSLPLNAFGDYIIRDLYLDLNQIHTVQSGAFGEAVKTLQSLSLTRNFLTSFPLQDLKMMKKLKQLGLGYNKLSHIKSDSFPASNSLESLDLSHNQIKRIEPDSFAELYAVTLIDLSRNNLTVIEPRSLLIKSMYQELVISLRGNAIKRVLPGAFGSYHPRGLDLSRNQLMYLDKRVFMPLLNNGTMINVEDNPFNCIGCSRYRWLLNLDKEAANNLENFACTDDTKLEDLTLESIGCSELDKDTDEPDKEAE